MSLIDLDAAIAELEFVMDRGARFIHLRPGPQGGRNPADPVFDPFWERVNEAGLTVTFHISESGYNELFSVHWGEEANPSSHQQSAFQWTRFYGDLPDHADDLGPDVHELLRPLPEHPGDVGRERIAVGALPARRRWTR